MTIQDKTIKLAEVAGFTDIMLPMGFHQQMSDEKSKECGGRWRFEIPKYFEDLNAVHEFEKLLTDEQWVIYRDNIRLIVLGPIRMVSQFLKADIHATAAQRCEAIGKTLDLW
jgi:hypothetical protein